MIDRYTYPEMGRIWTDENEFQTMLDIEICACEIMAELGEIPAEAVPVIKAKAKFTVPRIREIEKETRHDILAFLTAVAENVGDESKYIHLGLTSSDVKDTALGVMMKQAAGILLEDLEKFHAVLKRRAAEHKHTVMIGRTHGIHAEPLTLGLKFALWMDETERNIERLKRARDIVAVGKLSGAVGTYSNIDPRVEAYVCEKMGLKAARLATQVIQRDRHAEFLTTLGMFQATYRLDGEKVVVNVLLPDEIFLKEDKSTKKLSNFTYKNKFNLLSFSYRFATGIIMAYCKALELLRDPTIRYKYK